LRACLPEDEMMANSSTSTQLPRLYTRAMRREQQQ
jgi:hypothetical protein